MLWLVLVVLLVIALAGLPVGWAPLGSWHSWGYGPSSVLGVVVVVFVVLLLMGRL